MTMVLKNVRRNINRLLIAVVCLGTLITIAGFTYQEKTNLSGNEVLACELIQEPTYNQKTDALAKQVYLTTTELNVRKSADVNSKLLGTIDSGVSVTIDVTDNASWGYVREFKGYVNMDYLKSVPLSDVIGVVYLNMDKNPQIFSQPDEDHVASDITSYQAYKIRPTLYNDDYYMIGDHAYINKDVVSVEYYDRQYYEHFIQAPTSRGFKEYKPPVVFHKALCTNISEPSNLSLGEIQTLVAGTPFEGTASAFKEIDNQGVNAIFALSVAMLESGNGTSYLARAQNNIFGLDPYNGGMSFGNKAECVEYFGRLMQKHYFSNGRDTLDDINNVYEPYNSNWSSMVQDLMRQNVSKVMK